MTDQTSNPLPIDTVIIPVGGYGTRMLPMTQAVPKPLLPVGDKPLLVHAVDEALDAGIKEIIIPCRPDEYEIYKRQFEVSDDVRQKIIATGRDYLLEHLHKCEGVYATRVKVVPTYNDAGPAATVKDVVDECGLEGKSFGVILPDDLFISDEPVLAQMMETFSRTGATTVGTRDVCFKTERSVNGTFVGLYGIEGGPMTIGDMQIKPKDEDPISSTVTCGRYIFGPDFSHYADKAFDPSLKEISFSAVLKSMLDDDMSLAAHDAKGTYYDCGDFIKYQHAIAAFLAAEVLEAFSSRIADPGVTHPPVSNDTLAPVGSAFQKEA